MEPANFPRIFIVLPVYNRIDFTRTFLNSVRAQSYEKYSVIICDDGSTDGTKEYLERHYPEVTLISGDGNLWWTAGINRCVETALNCAKDSDYILSINNDVILPPGYLEQKVKRASQYPNALIGSLCVFLNEPDRIETSGLIMNWKQMKSRSLTRFGEQVSVKHQSVVEVTHLCAKGVMVPVEVFRRLGLYDQVDFPHYHADSDFSLRAHKVGYKILLDYESRLYSDINRKNVGYDGFRVTIKGFMQTFKGRYSLNNYGILKNFALKHFPERVNLYLTKTYFYIIGGFLKRYFRQFWGESLFR